MARYKRGEKAPLRTHQLRVQLTPQERATLQLAAQSRGTRLSQYVRELCLPKSAAVMAAMPTPNPEVQKLAKELNAIGNNLNQIARHLNSTGELPVEDLREALTLHKRAILRTLDL